MVTRNGKGNSGWTELNVLCLYRLVSFPRYSCLSEMSVRSLHSRLLLTYGTVPFLVPLTPTPPTPPVTRRAPSGG